MRAISFKLSGKTAFFKKPDVNQYAYFTYNNIHKIALLGLLGAIVGYGGYTQLFEKNRGLKKGSLEYDDGYPEFYEKLKHIKVSIIPLAKYGYFSKKIQVFNNSVGYASKEEGGNLIVREQWLENPAWQIMILDDSSDEYRLFKKYLLAKKAVFIPYLGKNDHIANIDDVKELKLSDKLFDIDGEYYIDSLFIDTNSYEYHRESDDAPYMFKEVFPMRLQEKYHFYEYESVVFTNFEPSITPKDTYCYEDKNYTFI
jgi:CRISPR-associated protein Cas5h